MTQDVSIIYQGGSGGFALYYYLLLSGRYQTEYPVNWQKQYPSVLLEQPTLWKLFETWPDNIHLKQSPNSPKLFLICNPCWNESMIQQNLLIVQDTFKIMLYTDLKLQLRMAWEKRAYWFTDISKKAFNAPTSNLEYIRSIISCADNGFDPMLSSIRKIYKPDVELQLEKFLKNPLIPGFDTPNTKQLEFLTHWMSIQPQKSQRLLAR